jgi:hypothetical protein
VVYSPSKVVACVKVDGKILREDKNVVTLPFGSEYSVFIKNLNPRRIKVKVSVDGTDATEDTWLVVDPNSTFDLERFIRAGNMDRGNRFKFIERTPGIEEHRGIKADDGLIRIEYQVEKEKPLVIDVEEHHHHYDHYDWHPRPYYPWSPWSPWRYSGTLGGTTKGLSPRPSASSSKSKGPLRSKSVMPASTTMDFDTELTKCSTNDQGITVPGGESNQKFRWTENFECGPSEVIVLQLRGCVGNQKVTQPITVQTKLECSTCGKSHPSSEKFCGACGTALRII